MNNVKVGDRIKLINMPDDPNPIEPGSVGTVVHASPPYGSLKGLYISVNWDSGRRLSVITPPDEFEIISD